MMDDDKIKVSWGPKEWGVVIAAIFFGLNTLLGTWLSYSNHETGTKNQQILQETKAVVDEHTATSTEVKAAVLKVSEAVKDVKKEQTEVKDALKRGSP